MVMPDKSPHFRPDGRSPGPGTARAVFAGSALVLFSCALTTLFLSMRQVMGAGGACGFDYGTPCPHGAAVATPLSVPLLVVSAGLYLAATHRSRTGSTLLLWLALFAAMGYNFFDYGALGTTVRPALLVCALLFAVIGAAPLIARTLFRTVSAPQRRTPHPSVQARSKSRSLLLLLLDTTVYSIGIWCGTLCWAYLSA